MFRNKIFIIIVAVVLVALSAFLIWWGVSNKDKIKEVADGTKIYTSEDLKKASEEAYKTALANEARYTSLITTYQTSIETLNDRISLTETEKQALETANEQLEEELAEFDYIIDLTAEEEETQARIDELNETIQNNNNQINSLDIEITALTNQRNTLQVTLADLNRDIASANENLIDVQNQTQTEIADKQAIIHNYDYVISLLDSYADMISVEFTTVPTETTDGVLTYSIIDEDVVLATWDMNIALSDCQYEVTAVPTCDTNGSAIISYGTISKTVPIARLGHNEQFDETYGLYICNTCGKLNSSGLAIDSPVKYIDLGSRYYTIFNVGNYYYLAFKTNANVITPVYSQISNVTCIYRIEFNSDDFSNYDLKLVKGSNILQINSFSISSEGMLNLYVTCNGRSLEKTNFDFIHQVSKNVSCSDIETCLNLSTTLDENGEWHVVQSYIE